MRLSLHFPRTDLEPGQFKLLIEDMVNDLEGFSIFDVERAANAWRTGGERFFPNSGQLIAKLDQMAEAAIARGRAARAAYTAPQVEHGVRYPKDHRPWRDILHEHGRPIPHSDDPLAKALDRLQNPES